jgi:hypothetical protein
METDSKRKERPMLWSLFSVGVARDSILKAERQKHLWQTSRAFRHPMGVQETGVLSFQTITLPNTIDVHEH